MSIHAIDENVDPVAQAKIDLAAALRLAVYHELEEGIDNHFTVTLPGYEDRFMVLPFGLHWSEASASDMIVFNEAGETLEGEGVVELSAQCIHAPIHRITGRRAQIRAMSTGQKLLPISQQVIEQVQTPDEHDRHKGQRDDLYFAAMKRLLDREMPGYAN